MAQNQRQTPRQKMINLMYIVLTAMLALNVSSDVLDGFTEVEQSVSRSTDNSATRNEALMASLSGFASHNEKKGGAWHSKATIVKNRADSLDRMIEALKLEIVAEADGPGGTPKDIKSREDLDAAPTVMLSPVGNKGRRLREAVEDFRQILMEMHCDWKKRDMIASVLSTDGTTNSDGVSRSWEEQKFDNMPAIAAITLLSQLQNDIRFAEGETLAELIKNIDAGEVRVNDINAIVLPRSQMVMRGSTYMAEIVLAAVDSTKRPAVSVNGQPLMPGSNTYSTTATGSGEVRYDGVVTVDHPDGTQSEHPFSGSYTVLDPMATVSATMMNVLYCGIDNPLSISVPGVPQQSVAATMTNGTIERRGNEWIARPDKTATDAEISVTAELDGSRRQMATHHFKVRRLPDPALYIPYSDAAGHRVSYRGGTSLPKASLLEAEGIEAAIDDDMLNIAFEVTGFETVFFDSMGNAMPEKSDGSRFSRRQKDTLRRLGRGKRFYISNAKAIGPDGIERSLAPLEVIIK